MRCLPHLSFFPFGPGQFLVYAMPLTKSPAICNWSRQFWMIVAGLFQFQSLPQFGSVDWLILETSFAWEICPSRSQLEFLWGYCVPGVYNSEKKEIRERMKVTPWQYLPWLREAKMNCLSSDIFFFLSHVTRSCRYLKLSRRDCIIFWIFQIFFTWIFPLCHIDSV